MTLEMMWLRRLVIASGNDYDVVGDILGVTSRTVQRYLSVGHINPTVVRTLELIYLGGTEELEEWLVNRARGDVY